jgi:Ribosomal protein L32
MLPEYVHSSDS